MTQREFKPRKWKKPFDRIHLKIDKEDHIKLKKVLKVKVLTTQEAWEHFVNSQIN